MTAHARMPLVRRCTNCSAISSGVRDPGLYQWPIQFSAPPMAKAASLVSHGATEPSATPSVI
jgi:hypothetical protein